MEYSAESAKSEIQFKNKNSVHSVFSVHSVQKWNSVKKWNSGCLVAGAAEDHELELQANDCNWWDYAFKWVKGDKRRNYNTPSKNFKTPWCEKPLQLEYCLHAKIIMVWETQITFKANENDENSTNFNSIMSLEKSINFYILGTNFTWPIFIRLPLQTTLRNLSKNKLIFNRCSIGYVK